MDPRLHGSNGLPLDPWQKTASKLGQRLTCIRPGPAVSCGRSGAFLRPISGRQHSSSAAALQQRPPDLSARRRETGVNTTSTARTGDRRIKSSKSPPRCLHSETQRPEAPPPEERGEDGEEHMVDRYGPQKGASKVSAAN